GRGGWAHVVMPATAIAINLMALLTRLVRTAVIEVLSEDYVRTARGKGLSELFVVTRHAVPNALIPLGTVIGVQFGYILGGAVLKPPFWLEDGSLHHPLGTDHLGRDVYSRLVYGAQISLTISVLAALLGAAVGVAAGLVAGYLGGRVDTVIMRIVDLNLAFPLILLALAVVALLGASLRNLVIVMSITTWMIYARVVRGLSITLREQ